MSTFVCEDHGENIVVFQGFRTTICPFCVAEQTIADLQNEVDDMKAARDNMEAGQ
jgi:hypothetical protein